MILGYLVGIADRWFAVAVADVVEQLLGEIVAAMLVSYLWHSKWV